MFKSKEELEVLSDDSTDVFKQNKTDRYNDMSKKCLSYTVCVILL